MQSYYKYTYLTRWTTDLVCDRLYYILLNLKFTFQQRMFKDKYYNYLFLYRSSEILVLVTALHVNIIIHVRDERATQIGLHVGYGGLSKGFRSRYSAYRGRHNKVDDAAVFKTSTPRNDD